LNAPRIEPTSYFNDITAVLHDLQACASLRDACEVLFHHVIKLIPVQIMLIHRNVVEGDQSLLFVRTQNDTTVTGSVITKEHEIVKTLIAEGQKTLISHIETKPAYHLLGQYANTGSASCCMVILRPQSPFSSEEAKLLEIFTYFLLPFIANQKVAEYDLLLNDNIAQTRQQNNFLTNITHDLRNPLGCIKGYTTTLLRTDIKWDDQTQLKFLNIINSETDRLADMITNMLETARLQSGQYELNFDQIAISTLMDTLIANNHEKHPEVNFSIEIPQNRIVLMVDPPKMIRAFQNIVDNAVKHANTLEICIKIIDNNNAIDFTFIDQGAGIPSSRIDNIFHKFSRIPNDAPGEHGSGLGLYITKQIIRKHGGEISISSSSENGTAVTITIPKIPS
jgi:K+-sensing histidine kinase KdpD